MKDFKTQLEARTAERLKAIENLRTQVLTKLPEALDCIDALSSILGSLGDAINEVEDSHESTNVFGASHCEALRAFADALYKLKFDTKLYGDYTYPGDDDTSSLSDYLGRLVLEMKGEAP